MKNNSSINQKLRKTGILLITLLGVAGLTACNTKKIDTVAQESEQIQEQGSTQEANEQPTQEPSEDPTQEPTQAPAELSTENQTTDTDQGQDAAEVTNQYKDLSQLGTLLGLSKEELIEQVDSEHTTIDEGGLEFSQPEIRVWFDKDGKVNQIFTVDKGIDFNGTKIGDNIKSFVEKFGEPTKDNNGEAHFTYKDIFILVHYDSETGSTYDVYLLKEDF